MCGKYRYYSSWAEQQLVITNLIHLERLCLGCLPGLPAWAALAAVAWWLEN